MSIATQHMVMAALQVVATVKIDPLPRVSPVRPAKMKKFQANSKTKVESKSKSKNKSPQFHKQQRVRQSVKSV